ncbi:MAG TPA: hypothetical protein PLH56_00545 [Candidatus Omnitrophota bacterium]|nr:hypothetical protein [Candidatus Omnitrophota bacterium]
MKNTKILLKYFIICFFIVAFLSGFAIDFSYALTDQMCCCCHSCCNESVKTCACPMYQTNPTFFSLHQIEFNFMVVGYVFPKPTTVCSRISSRDIFHPPNLS